jgi:hypothetical protein
MILRDSRGSWLDHHALCIGEWSSNFSGIDHVGHQEFTLRQHIAGYEDFPTATIMAQAYE